MFKLFKNNAIRAALGASRIGKVQVTFTPSDPQKGQISMSRSVTADQWEAIKRILN